MSVPESLTFDKASMDANKSITDVDTRYVLSIAPMTVAPFTFPLKLPAFSGYIKYWASFPSPIAINENLFPFSS